MIDRRHRHPYKWILAFIVLMVGCTSTGWAKDRVNTNWWGVALKGYDVVAYFEMGKAVKGDKDFEYKWQGAKWRFANARHLELFKADPEAYAPQYGGY